MIRERQRFQAQGTSGKIYTIVERQQIIETTPISGRRQQIGGMLDYVLDTGEHVNYESDTTYTIVQTDEVLTRI